MTDLDALHRLERLATRAGALAIAEEAAALGRRVAEGRFYLACVGECKRGKSTLINSLLDTTVLPAGIVPVTAVPTVVRYGEEAVRVRIGSVWHSIEPGALLDYVSQERNPDNSKGVTGAEVFLPRELLRDGLCLVDTPGLGSVFEANTAATVDFLPHIDAALLVVGADPPISGDERRFVADLASRVDTVICVVNKADRIPEAQRGEALGFTRAVLRQTLGRPVDPIYEVSAIAAVRGPAALQGWHALRAELAALPAESGRRIVAGAVRHGRGRLGRRLAALLAEERGALLAPLRESDRRLSALEELRGRAARTGRELQPLLDLETKTQLDVFERRGREFLEQAVPRARAELLERLDPRQSRSTALALAEEIARAGLRPWLGTAQGEASHVYQAATRRLAVLVTEFATRVAASTGLGADTIALDDDVAAWSELRAPSEFYFASLLSQHESPLPWASLLDRLTPRWLAGPRRRHAALEYLEHLLTTNATRVESDLRERVRQSGRRLTAALTRVLAAAAEAAAQAAARARAARRAGAETVAREVAQLDGWLVELAAPVEPPTVALDAEAR